MVLSTVLYKSFICLLSSPPAHLSLTLTYIDLDRRVAVLLLDCCSSRSWIPSIWPVYTRLQRALHRPRPRLLRQPREHTRPPTRGIAHSLVDRTHEPNRTEPLIYFCSCTSVCTNVSPYSMCRFFPERGANFAGTFNLLSAPSGSRHAHADSLTRSLTRSLAISISINI